MTPDDATLPLAVSVQMAHAAIQVLAEDNQIDLLHIKGPAVDSRLLQQREVVDPETREVVWEPVPRDSLDADVLVRPVHVGRLLRAMTAHGWALKVPFEAGSAFEHAATLAHPFLGHVDLHREFPGIGLAPDKAFGRIWAEREQAQIAGVACPVPSLAAQRLLLIVHAARGRIDNNGDVRRAWYAADPLEQEAVRALAADLGADVALAAGTGRLHEFSNSRQHDLWLALSTGETSLPRLWKARVRAAPNPASALRIGIKLILPRAGRLAVQLGRTPTLRELGGLWIRHFRLIGQMAVSTAGRLRGKARR